MQSRVARNSKVVSNADVPTPNVGGGASGETKTPVRARNTD